MATLYQKMQLLNGLLSGDTARTGPFYVDVDLTRRCNLKCLGCPYQSPNLTITQPRDAGVIDLPFDVFKQLCVELKSMRTRSLILQGAGEPLLHPNIFDIISTAKSEGFDVTLLTNGTLLDRDAIKAFVDLKLDTVKVSLWASSVEQYQENYPRNDPDNFNKVLNGLRLLSAIKAERDSVVPTVIVFHVINRTNFQTMGAMVDLVSEAGCDGLFFSPMHNFRSELDSFMLSPEEEDLVKLDLNRSKKRLESLSKLHNIDSTLLRYEIGGDIWETLPCYVPWFHARIRADGMVQVCGRCDSDVDFGDLRANSFHDIWNGEAIRAFRRQTRTPEGLASVTNHCDCAYCYFIGDMMRVHRLLRWVSPFSRHSKN